MPKPIREQQIITKDGKSRLPYSRDTSCFLPITKNSNQKINMIVLIKKYVVIVIFLF